jgi:hypothetical protein
VAAWGDIEVHATGFRAEYARVIALSGSARRGVANPHRVAGRYGVVLVDHVDLPAHAAAAGSPIPEELRPELPEGMDPYAGQTGVTVPIDFIVAANAASGVALTHQKWATAMAKAVGAIRSLRCG